MNGGNLETSDGERGSDKERLLDSNLGYDTQQTSVSNVTVNSSRSTAI